MKRGAKHADTLDTDIKNEENKCKKKILSLLSNYTAESCYSDTSASVT